MDTDAFLALVMILVAENAPATDIEAVVFFREAEREARRFASIPRVRSAIEAVMLELLPRDRLTGADIREAIAMLPAPASCLQMQEQRGIQSP